MTHVQLRAKDVYSRMIDIAFWAKVPGATARDRLEYLRELFHNYGLEIVDRRTTPPLVPDFTGRRNRQPRSVAYT
jgi:hypothetical protein